MYDCVTPHAWSCIKKLEGKEKTHKLVTFAPEPYQYYSSSFKKKNIKPHTKININSWLQVRCSWILQRRSASTELSTVLSTEYYNAISKVFSLKAKKNKHHENQFHASRSIAHLLYIKSTKSKSHNVTAYCSIQWLTRFTTP